MSGQAENGKEMIWARKERRSITVRTSDKKGRERERETERQRKRERERERERERQRDRETEILCR